MIQNNLSEQEALFESYMLERCVSSKVGSVHGNVSHSEGAGTCSEGPISYAYGSDVEIVI